jgi:biopolymer transport protein ExbB
MRILFTAAPAVRLAWWLAAVAAAGLLLEHGAAAQTTVTIPAAALESQAAPDAAADAAPISAGRRSVLDVVRAGGVLMIPLFICSFVMLVFIFEKFISLRRRRVIPTPFVKRLLEQIRAGQLDRDQALACCEENPSHVAKVFGAALLKWGRPAVEVEQAILDSGERASNLLRRYLRVINGAATVSPLLGLLGTVLGIMTAFNEVAGSDAMGRPELLASGIGEALITTASGLFIAIPALIFYMYFTGRVDQLIIEMDALGQELVNLISAEAIQDRANARPKRKLAA